MHPLRTRCLSLLYLAPLEPPRVKVKVGAEVLAAAGEVLKMGKAETAERSGGRGAIHRLHIWLIVQSSTQDIRSSSVRQEQQHLFWCSFACDSFVQRALGNITRNPVNGQPGIIDSQSPMSRTKPSSDVVQLSPTSGILMPSRHPQQGQGLGCDDRTWLPCVFYACQTSAMRFPSCRLWM